MTPEELELRRHYIGGSEIAALVGEDSFATPFDIWLSKLHGWSRPETDDMKRGLYLESGIAAWSADRMGWSVSMVAPVVHASVAIARCSPDRVVESGAGTYSLLSIKSPRRGGWLWGEDGSSDVPPGYALQLQWEHACVSSRGQHLLTNELYLAAPVDGDLRIYRLAADKELQAWLLEYAQAWWARHVAGEVEPPMDGSKSARAWLKAKFRAPLAPLREATPAEDVAMLRLRAAEATAERAEAEAEDARLELMGAIGDSQGIQGPAGRVTWRTDKNGCRVFRTKWNKET